MATIPQIRGALLEEAVLYLLSLVGYRIVKPHEEGTGSSSSGLIVQGRGTWHQIDALAAYDKTPAFMYPLRLIVEAKCYASGSVKIDVVRNLVGVLKDISENYFSHSTFGNKEKIQVQRFSYQGAIFSTSGYSHGAQKYALAHQIFLIQYDNVYVIKPVIEAIKNLNERHFSEAGKNSISTVRIHFRKMLDLNHLNSHECFTNQGIDLLNDVLNNLKQIRGSYFGMLQGRWPLHLLSKKPLPAGAFQGDELPCRIYGYESNKWCFEPTQINPDSDDFFRLEFDLPEEIVNLVDKARGNPEKLANVKGQHFSYLDLSGKIGDIQRQVRLRLDDDWMRRYLNKMKKKAQKKFSR